MGTPCCQAAVCNTGALATGGHGTALGMVRSALARGRQIQLFACETRPYNQGSRLTTWECSQDGIPCTLVTDSMAASLMAGGKVSAVVAGCDRVANNGDTANKIGTYSLAVLAHYHKYNSPRTDSALFYLLTFLSLPGSPSISECRCPPWTEVAPVVRIFL